MKIVVKESKKVNVAGGNLKTELEAYKVEKLDEKVIYSEIQTLIVDDIENTFCIGEEYDIEINDNDSIKNSCLVLNVSKYKQVEVNQDLLKQLSDKGKSRLREYLKKYSYLFEEHKAIFDLCAFSIKLYLDKLSYSGLNHRMYTGGAIDMLENITNIIANFDSNNLSKMDKCVSIYLLIVKTIQEIESHSLYGYGLLGEESFETYAFGVNFDMLNDLSSIIEECYGKDKSGIMFF